MYQMWGVTVSSAGGDCIQEGGDCINPPYQNFNRPSSTRFVKDLFSKAAQGQATTPVKQETRSSIYISKYMIGEGGLVKKSFERCVAGEQRPLS